MLKKKYITVLALTVLGLLSTACSSAPVSPAQNAKPSAPAQATATKPTVTAIKFGTAPGLKPLAERTGKVSKVYFTRDISGTGLKKIYDKDLNFRNKYDFYPEIGLLIKESLHSHEQLFDSMLHVVNGIEQKMK